MSTHIPYHERAGQIPVVPKYRGLTFLKNAAAKLKVYPETLRVWLRELGLAPEERQGTDAYGRVVSRSYVWNSDLEQVKNSHKPGRLSKEEVTLEETADILWPNEAKELRRLRRDVADKAAYEKLRERHLGHVYHLVRQGLLTPADEAHKRLVHYTASYRNGKKAKRVLLPTMTFSKAVVLQLKVNGIRPSPSELPAHWKGADDMADERKRSKGRRQNRHGQHHAPGGFRTWLCGQRSKSPNIAKKSWYIDAKGRPRWEWKYDTTLVYPILDGKKKEQKQAARAAKMLRILDELDRERKGVTKRRLRKACRFGLRDKTIEYLLDKGELEKVSVQVPAGHQGRTLRVWQGVRRPCASATTDPAQCQPGSEERRSRAGRRYDPNSKSAEVYRFCYEEYRVKGRKRRSVWTDALARFKSRAPQEESSVTIYANRHAHYNSLPIDP